MKPAPFESRPEFQHFKEEMRRILNVPKDTLDQRVEAAAKESSRKRPGSPGRKRSRRSS